MLEPLYNRVDSVGQYAGRCSLRSDRTFRCPPSPPEAVSVHHTVSREQHMLPSRGHAIQSGCPRGVGLGSGERPSFFASMNTIHQRESPHNREIHVQLQNTRETMARAVVLHSIGVDDGLCGSMRALPRTTPAHMTRLLHHMNGPARQATVGARTDFIAYLNDGSFLRDGAS